MKENNNINILAQSMWGLRVIQFGDAHAYELQEYRDTSWVTITGSRLRSYVFKKFHTLAHELGNDARGPSPFGPPLVLE